MSTSPSALTSHPAATAGFVLAVGATLVGLFFTAAWVGFAPAAILPAIAAYLLGRRAGVLTPTTAPRRAAGAALLVVVVLAVGLGILMWSGGRG